jgi:hypothetical protein
MPKSPVTFAEIASVAIVGGGWRRWWRSSERFVGIELGGLTVGHELITPSLLHLGAIDGP